MLNVLYLRCYLVISIAPGVLKLKYRNNPYYGDGTCHDKCRQSVTCLQWDWREQKLTDPDSTVVNV